VSQANEQGHWQTDRPVRHYQTDHQSVGSAAQDGQQECVWYGFDQSGPDSDRRLTRQAVPQSTLSGDSPSDSLPSLVDSADLPPVRSWVFKPNCSLAPRQLAYFYLSVVLLTLGIAAGFCMFGMWLVLPFAGIELTVVGCALLIYARHAGDYEQIRLEGRELSVTVVRASRLSSVRLNPSWTKVSLSDPGRLLRLESGSVRVAVGRYVTQPARERLVYELRRAFAAAAA